MQTSAAQHAPSNLSPQLYYQLVHTLTALLPPPLDQSPAALRARNHAAIAKAASMLPVNANEADLAAQCVAARGQAEYLLRVVRENEGDIALTIRLSAQYASMARASVAAQATLLRVQAVRQKREAIEAVATQDSWTLHIAEQSMLKVAEDIEAVTAAAPVPPDDQQIAENVSETNLNSHDMAFETPMSARCPNRPDETGPRENRREAMAGSRLAGPDLSTDGRACPGGTGFDRSAERNQIAPEKNQANRTAPEGVELAVMPRDAQGMIADTKAKIFAAAVTKPNTPARAEPAPAAPAKPAAPRDAPTTVAERKQSLQPPRVANPRDKLLWADAMTTVAEEMTAGLSALPRAYRKQQLMRARLLSSVAKDVMLLASSTPSQRHTVIVRKT
jgi:hypothetical protein